MPNVAIATPNGDSAMDETANTVEVSGAAATDAAAAGNPVLIGGEMDDTSPVNIEEGDVGSLRVDAKRNLYITVRDAAGNERGLNVDASGYLTTILAAGSAAFGKLAANDGVDIGDVDIASIAAGETHIGEVGGAGTTISQTPTITGGAYSANDAVGGLLTFANAARVSGGGGFITNIQIIDDSGQKPNLELWLFKVTFTAMTDNAAWAPSEADLENWVGTFSTNDGTWRNAGTPEACDIEKIKRYDLTGTSLFGQLVDRTGATFVATDDLTVKVGLAQD